ncbi:calcium-binding protein [Jannaschia sp. M317]|uniref:calcium-binding protein n=1 Tax=Jannaschia sp. M317 TaxID=2867011 RepID=UPI0021A936C1|nr:calcium-binding protein [Jannaschia sp. M317]UWQ19647.1 hypothetical protein K3551_18305 [Jannaschia sp. M317]
MTNLLGTDGDDDGIANPVLTGTAGNDVISGFTGNDLLEGLAGDDFLSPGFGADTVRAGAGDDRVLVVETLTEGDVLDGGDGFDRLISGAANTVAIDAGTVTGFERIDLNNGALRLTGAQLDGVTQITGFGPGGSLFVLRPTDLDLGAITLGADDTGVGRITVRFDRTATDPFTWDASGSGATWYLDVQSALGRATLTGGAGDDTLLGNETHDLFGGAGDDVLSLRTFRAVPIPLVVDGGDGRDTYGRADYGNNLELDNITFRNVEVLSGRAIGTAETLLSFEALEGIGYLELSAPGTLDLSGRIGSVTGRRITGAEEFRLRGSDGNDMLTWTDTRFAIHMNGDLGSDTLVTGAGNDSILGSFARTPGLVDHDLIRSGDGSDTILGASGNDTIIAWGSDADGADRVEGGTGSDSIEGGAGNDVLLASGAFFGAPDDDTGDDTIDGGDGADRILGAGGRDLLIGGTSEADLGDVIFGFSGNDTIRGGAGNDDANGGAGNDVLDGGTGSDTLAGGAGDDTISGGALSDVIFGGDGMDFINGGFGSDRINLGAGADRVFHAGVAGHGSDWIQDFAAEDALVAVDTARAADFQVNTATTAGAGAGDVEEAFVIYRPTGQILWALVDGDGQDTITLRIDEVDHQLMI